MSIITDTNAIIAKLTSLFSAIESVEFAYLFGSAAKNKTSPISDLDVAVYFNEQSGVLSDWRFRIELIGKIMDACKINEVDLIY